MTITDREDKELFQIDYKQLELALQELNLRYGHWELMDPTASKSAGGCGSCEAH